MIKRFIKGNTQFVMWHLFRCAPFEIIAILLLSAAFLIFQVMSLWLIISWFGGEVLQPVKEVFGFESESNVYPVIAAICLVMASLMYLLAKLLTVNSIDKSIKKIEGRIPTGIVSPSSYKSLSKLMLALVDSLVPLVFILAVCIYWVALLPFLAPFIFLVLILIYFNFKKLIEYASKAVHRKVIIKKGTMYVGGEDHAALRKVMLLPAYINVSIYLIIGCLINITAVFSGEYTLENDTLNILLIITAVAIFRLKSFVGLVIKIGAHRRSTEKIIKILRLD